MSSLPASIYADDIWETGWKGTISQRGKRRKSRPSAYFLNTVMVELESGLRNSGNHSPNSTCNTQSKTFHTHAT